MRTANPSSKTYSLKELLTRIKREISVSFPDTFWVQAEIAELKVNRNGHCYLTFVQKDDQKLIAKIEAVIWGSLYPALSGKFVRATKETLKAGMQVLVAARVEFHELYSIKLTVTDIDPRFTLGEMALNKQRTLEKLREQGLTETNKQIPLPTAPRRIAVVSSAGAAGYQDFVKQLHRNPFGYAFAHVLFQATMQGAGAESSLIAALTRVAARAAFFDVVIVIRGGGSTVDLDCYDSYALAEHAAKLPLPLITGIGHDKDESVLDAVAHTSQKTPTAVADFLIGRVHDTDTRLTEQSTALLRGVQRILTARRAEFIQLAHRLAASVGPALTSAHTELARREAGFAAAGARVVQRQQTEVARLHDLLLVAATRRAVAERSALDMHARNLAQASIRRLDLETRTLERIDDRVRLSDPERLLKRGYSITCAPDGRILTSTNGLATGETISTRLFAGTITSKITGLEDGTSGGN